AHYATSAHFLWIGDRTRQLTGAHIEFFRGIANPIGIKIGPTLSPEELTSLLDTVNPTKEIGKVTLISRYGASTIAKHLPGHIAAVQKSGHIPVWQCDPMHGNTHTTPSGVKTRDFRNILTELKQALEIHRSMGSFLGGMHLELTGEPVTECIGGAGGLTEEGLGERYTTFCDPRLNEKQALELAFLVAGFYREDLEGSIWERSP
ncbi:phospho-2-dehydro-3-deoxyheptonate aldolase, partial [Aspergillus sclerotialis]